MRHTVFGWVNGEGAEIDSSKTEHDALRASIAGLQRILAIEEKFDLVVENYDELEAEMATIQRRSAIFRYQRFERGAADIYRVNRRLLNLLSTGRLYVDHVAHDLSVIYGSESTQFRSFRNACSEQFDSLVGYRVMEALRNYSQHRGIPVHGLTYGSAVKEELQGRIQHTLRPRVVVARLVAEGGLKKQALDELKKLGAEADLKPLMRDYVSGLAAVHGAVREIVNEREAKWTHDLATVQTRFATATGSRGGELREAVVWGPALRGRARVDDRFSVFGGFRERLHYLRAKNIRIGDLTKHVHISD